MRAPVTRSRLLILLAVVSFAAVACSDHDAQDDLPVDKQTQDYSEAFTAVMPDGFPNIAHKCVAYGAGPVVGMWTTTDRSVLLIYNDHTCAEANAEQPQEIISMIPRSMVSASSG
jgi:hypothetical protein